ncbi:MAG: PKD domain-containing protein [Saprospiraceae bacterium]
MKRIYHIILGTVLLFCCVTPLSAKHIIGGEITYVCNGGGVYTFTMKIYRDCSSDGADFDSPAFIGIYRGSTFLGKLDVNIDGGINNIPPVIKPCLILPEGICVQEAVYTFQATLPTVSQSYHIVYQRCCRNNTITNIVDPGDSGATYTVELTPEAQGVCNNSPTYDSFPPIVICAGESIDFDHGATDPDGDQLVYEFCSPLLGGGNNGLQDPFVAATCIGIRPDPPCGPPFDDVEFLVPAYSALEPMGGSPLITIDPNTGFISGIPTNLGQYVVGVCVSEFRNGQLLSQVRRDFQFNVANCQPTVVAEIQHDELIGDQEYVINSCGTNTVEFVNESFQEAFITDFFWEFEINGVTETFTEWSPTITFPGLGTYEGILALNPGEDCGDTARIFVNVFPDINADFSFVYDTCVAGPVDFTDLSTTGSGTMTNWDWDFGDGNFSTDQNPSHLFQSPGLQEVTLTVTDINNCQESLTQIVNWFPVPPVLIIEPTTFLGCEPLPIFFNNLSSPIDSTYDIVWDFGDGNTSGAVSPTHIYEEEGIYTIGLQVTSPIGCYIDTIFPNWITVRPSPVADFTYTPRNPSNFNPTVNFIDQSIDAILWDWTFDDLDFSLEQNPTYTFPDTGFHEVRLVVTHPSGCQDTAIQRIDVEPQIRYFLPNAFTPNSDALNDDFLGKGYFDGLSNFRMTIWNRWGELVFESRDPNIGWNGQKNNAGKQSPSGVYVCLVTFIGPRGTTTELKGFATLIR